MKEPMSTPDLTFSKLANLIFGLANGGYKGTEFAVSQTPATGSVRFRCVGEKGVGVVEVTVGSAAPVVVPVGGLSDGEVASVVAVALNASPDVSQLVSAVASGDTAYLTAKQTGPDGNSVGLFALTDAGVVIRSGPFLSGGANLISLL